MISSKEAEARIIKALSPLESEVVSLTESLGRVIRVPLNATRSLPRFDNSAMDGFAVQSHDTLGATPESPKRLTLTGMIPAGATPTEAVKPGEAMRIFTGAMLPAGADAVVIQENTRKEGSDVLIMRPCTPKKNIRFAGEDMQQGSPLLPAGQLIGPGEIAVLAAQAKLFVEVFRRPRVAIVPTGDEVQEIDRPLAPGHIPNSNSHMLAAQIKRCGGIPVPQPVAPDAPERLLECLTEAAKSADLVLTCGGVSVGDFDYVKSTLQSAGEVNFWKVAIKPGKPLAFGHLFGKPLLGLPGNPVSSFVTFELFARAAILRLGGHPATPHPTVTARLTTEVAQNPTREQFLRGSVQPDKMFHYATPVIKQGSGQLSSMLGINALLQIPAGDGTLDAGDSVTAHYLNSSSPH